MDRERALISFIFGGHGRAVGSEWGFRVKFAVADLYIFRPMAAQNGESIIVSTGRLHRHDRTTLFQLTLLVVSLLFRHPYVHEHADETPSQSPYASSSKCCQENSACDSGTESWNEECCCRT